MSEWGPSDSVAQFRAALDQLESMYRDTIAESAVRMEKTMLDAGASEVLAQAFALEWGQRMMDITKLGRLDV